MKQSTCQSSWFCVDFLRQCVPHRADQGMGRATGPCLKACWRVDGSICPSGCFYSPWGGEEWGRQRRWVEKWKVLCIRHAAGRSYLRPVCSLWSRVWAWLPWPTPFCSLWFFFCLFLAERVKVQWYPMLETWEILSPKERHYVFPLSVRDHHSVPSPQLAWLMDTKQLELEADSQERIQRLLPIKGCN